MLVLQCKINLCQLMCLGKSWQNRNKVLNEKDTPLSGTTFQLQLKGALMEEL